MLALHVNVLFYLLTASYMLGVRDIEALLCTRWDDSDRPHCSHPPGICRLSREPFTVWPRAVGGRRGSRPETSCGVEVGRCCAEEDAAWHNTVFLVNAPQRSPFDEWSNVIYGVYQLSVIQPGKPESFAVCPITVYVTLGYTVLCWIFHVILVF